MTSIEDQTEIYKVPLYRTKSNTNSDKNNSYPCHEYTIRGLLEHEVLPWSEFCASIFSYKANPPAAEYFYRHYANDPSTKAPGSSKLIRCAFSGNTMVASCRIFLRTISSGSKEGRIRTGGIGEVCTAVNHRRRGLSTKLLENAIAIMTERSDFQLSSLHAAPTFFPLYESLGYCAPPPTNSLGGNRWSIVNLRLGRDFGTISMGESEAISIRPAIFPQDTAELQSLHMKYSEERLAGCIVRSIDYWNDYLSKELDNSLFVATSPFDQSIIAWVSIKPYHGESNDSFCIQEFGADSAFFQKEEALTLGHLVGSMLIHIGIGNEKESDEVEVSLKLPGLLADELRQSSSSGRSFGRSFEFDWASECTEVDNGWMYRGVGDCDARVQDFLHLVRGTVDPAKDHEQLQRLPQRQHFVWPSDSF